MIENFAFDRRITEFKERVLGVDDFKECVKHIHIRMKHGFQVVVSGAYSPCMQGMHCMPSHLAKKENNNLNKDM